MKCCGTCGFWVDAKKRPNVTELVGTCAAPLPDLPSAYELDDWCVSHMFETDGTTCPCHEPKDAADR